MKPSNKTWPPPPICSRLETEADADDDDWLGANDLLRDVTWRDYAVVTFAALWLLLACVAIAFHHRLPAGLVKNVPHLVRIVLS